MYNLKRKSPLLLLGILTFSLMLLLNPLSSVESKSGDPLQQQEESKSKPFKVVVNLEYTEKQYKEGVGKISLYYEDSDGFKKTKTYDFNEMMQRAFPDHVKVKSKVSEEFRKPF